MRLIDADALRAQMYHEAFETDTDMQRWDGGCWIRYKMFENAIGNAPTIEPQRMRGKWIRAEYQREEDIINGNYMFVCSNCSHVDFHAKTVEVPYCWYCGADMRGDAQ